MKTKSSKRIIGKAISLALTICVLFSLLAPTHIYASEQEENEFNNRDCNIDDCFYGNEISLYLDDESDRHFLNLVTVSFLTNSNCDISSIQYEVNGFSIDYISIDENNSKKINIELTCLNAYCYLSLTAILADGMEVNAHLFAISNEYGIFISPFSEENATDEYYQYMVNNDLMTEVERRELKNECNKQFVEEEITSYPLKTNEENNARASTVGSGNTQYKITVYWVGDNNVSHKVEGAKVEIYDDQPINDKLLTTLETSLTDGTCIYKFNNPDRIIDLESGGYDLYAKIYPCDINGSVNVVDANGNQYCYQTQIMQNVSTGNTHQITVKFYMSKVTENIGSGDSNTNGTIGHSMQIFQALNFAKRYTNSQTSSKIGRNMDPVTAYYPYALTDSIATYNSSNKIIKISGKTSSTPNARNNYDAWDAIMHEYGHHVEYQCGLILQSGISYISRTSNLADESNSNSKLSSQKLAWSEGFADVFAALVQNFYSTNLASIPYVNNQYLDNGNGTNFYNFETFNLKKGDACIAVVAAVLWDVFDGNNEYSGTTSQPNDTIYLGHSQYWDFILDYRPTTLYDFAGYFFDEFHFEGAISLGNILTYYRVASEIRTSVSGGTSRNNPLSISWIPCGGTTRFPNNKFFISVLNEDGEEICSILDLTTTQHTFSQEHWNNIYYNSDGTIRISIICFQTTESETGWYFSAPYIFELP